MATRIPFVRDFEFEYGKAATLSPLVRRVIANNPGPFTFTGTGVYIIGRGEVAVVDPGPMLDVHFEALKRAIEGETVTHVLVTHSHMDHSPLAHPLAQWAGCKVYAGGPAIPTESDVRMEAGDDLSFKPDITVRDGDVIQGNGWTIDAIASPGHTSNHFCFGLREESTVFSGDHVMGWSTTVISPPDGHMGDYIKSLKKVRDRDFTTLCPTHGPPVTNDLRGFLQAYIDHRAGRERAIVERMAAGDTRIPQMVATIYADVDKRLHPAACHSVLAHMQWLIEQGLVSADRTPGVDAHYQLVQAA